MELVGLSEENIKKISEYKKEDSYFTNYRLESYKYFNELDMPSFGP